MSQPTEGATSAAWLEIQLAAQSDLVSKKQPLPGYYVQQYVDAMTVELQGRIKQLEQVIKEIEMDPYCPIRFREMIQNACLKTNSASG